MDDHWTTDGADVSVQLLTDHHGQADESVNLSQPAHVDSFFSIYYSSARFTAETVLAMFSAAVNAAVLTTLVVGRQCWTQGHHSIGHIKVEVISQLGQGHAQGHHSKTVYRCLFANLAVADCLSSVSMWLGNNLTLTFRVT